MRSARVLITGGAGFIGSHAAEHLLTRGHQVFVADNLSQGVLENVPPDAAFLQVDLAGAGLEDALEWSRPEVIVHLAAQIDLRASFVDPVEDCRQNVLMTLRLFQAGAHRGVRQFIFSSSGGAIYGEAIDGPQSEDHAEAPVSPYGVSKLASDHYLRVLSESTGCLATSLRFSNVYGPRQGLAGEAGVVGIFARRLAEGSALTIHGDGLQTRDFIHAGDLSRAISAVISARAGGIYNLGTGIETSILELARQLRALSGVDAPIDHAPGIAREQRRSVLDPGKAQRVLNWEPTIQLNAGLGETWAWFKQRYAANS